MDDGKSIRYKDLYALFEQILEKTMRLEQRDWSESPVKVWVNTFKIFLDEFMTEYKPMDSTISKVPPPPLTFCLVQLIVIAAIGYVAKHHTVYCMQSELKPWFRWAGSYIGS